VDEGMHFDLVLRYAHGEAPCQIEFMSTNFAPYFGLMSSHEFYERPTDFSGGESLYGGTSANGSVCRMGGWCIGCDF
jgi:hypothetical protein